MNLQDVVLHKIKDPSLLEALLSKESCQKDEISGILESIEEVIVGITPKNSCEVLLEVQRLRNKLSDEINRRT